MTSKCGKVKNPCKICLKTVNPKSGIQCQGACQKWVHYACLNYTPGRIKDIKQGIIKVTCPCPDCKTGYPKEFRTDEPLTCTNIQCPSNLPRQCTNITCPSNQKLNQTSDTLMSPPLLLCDKDACKVNQNKPSHENFIKKMSGPGSSNSSGACSVCPPIMKRSSSDHLAGDRRRNVMPTSLSILNQICSTVGELSKQINCLMNQMKKGKERYPVIESRNVQQTTNKRFDQGETKPKCPKPCYCPENPLNS